jgi:hypothetical protein
VTYRRIARQRFSRHIPSEAYTHNNRTSIARQRISKQAFSTMKRLCFLRGPCRGVIKEQRRSLELVVVGNWVSSSGNCSRRWLRKNGTKWIRTRKEDFMCDLKLQWDCYKSVARKRLMKTENPSACGTVNCKVCKSAIAL